MVNRTDFEPIIIDDFNHDPINQEKVQSYPPELVGRFNSFIVTAFDDSMTVEMQIRTMIKWVKENIDVTMSALDNMEAFKQDSMAFQNHVKDTLVSLINQFTDTFDDNLQFEMQEILKQWDNDGYLESLINEYTNERMDILDTIKINKGEVTIADFDQQSKEYLANVAENGFPVVSENSVGTPNIIDYSVTKNKLSPDVERNIYNFNATNLIKNGDGSNGVYGWTAVAGTHANVNGEIEMTADGSQTYNINQRALTDLTVGHKYYLKADVRVDNPDALLIGLLMINSPETIITINNPIENQTYTISGIFTATKEIQQFSIRHQYADGNSALGKKLYFDNVVAFNLTKTFRGKIPTVKQLNEIMGYLPNMYFEGSKAPLIDNTIMFNIFNDLRLKTLAGRVIKGTPKQIDVADGGGTVQDPVLSIPKNPMLMQPVNATATLSANLAPALDSWTGLNGATFSNGAWEIPKKGQLKTTFEVEPSREYLIEMKFTKTNDYGVKNPPRMYATLGNTGTPPMFVGFDDGLYKFTLSTTQSGQVELTLGDGVSDWYATITDITIKRVDGRVTPSGKLGIGLFDVTTFSQSLAIGDGLQKRATGDMNLAFGLGALRELTVGNMNTAIGTNALEKLTIGLNNLAIGHQPLRNLKSGYYNIALGYSPMLNNISGSWNISIGNESLRDMVDGDFNTVVGSRAMNDFITGEGNTVMGREAGKFPAENGLASTKRGSHNTFIGRRSGQSVTKDIDNATALGAYAVSGLDGLAIGWKAKAVGDRAVAIGSYAVAETADEFVLGTENHHVKVKGRFNIKQYTPTGTDDTVGIVGDICADDNYIYTKTSTGWKRTPQLETF